MSPDVGHGLHAAFGLADHRQHTALRQDGSDELVHPRGGRGAGRTDRFAGHGIHRADVVDDATPEINGQRLAALEEIDQALVSRITRREHAA